MTGNPPVLDMRGVAKSFPTPRGEARVLREVHMTIRPGDFVALTGPSGSGKTTLLNLAALLDLPTRGQVLFDGATVSDLDETTLCAVRKERIGMVYQNFYLLPHRSALDNVLFRFRYLEIDADLARDHAERALAGVGLGHIAAQPARLLSGGEMQRVAIARAIALRPRLLAADEPTGNLDAESARRVMNCFAALNRQGMTILLATHNETLLPYCTRRLVCREGRIEEAA